MEDFYQTASVKIMIQSVVQAVPEPGSSFKSWRYLLPQVEPNGEVMTRNPQGLLLPPEPTPS